MTIRDKVEMITSISNITKHTTVYFLDDLTIEMIINLFTDDNDPKEIHSAFSDWLIDKLNYFNKYYGLTLIGGFHLCIEIFHKDNRIRFILIRNIDSEKEPCIYYKLSTNNQYRVLSDNVIFKQFVGNLIRLDKSRKKRKYDTD